MTGRSNREQTPSVLLTRCVAGKNGTSPERPSSSDRSVGAAQEKVPGSLTVGTIAGEDIISPPSQHGAGLLHGSHDGAPQGAQAGAPHAGVADIGGCCRRLKQPSFRNSMNDGRPEFGPKQLQPEKALRQTNPAISSGMRDITVSPPQ